MATNFTPTDVQKAKLEKLMKNIDKPIEIPQRPKGGKFVEPPDFIRNIMGSSAGAGSGEFHVYRHLRRKEYARQRWIEEQAKREEMDRKWQEKLEENRRKAEERTAKKRAKRLKKKEKMKIIKRTKKNKSNQVQNKSTTEDETDEDESEDSDNEVDNNKTGKSTEEIKSSGEIENQDHDEIIGPLPVNDSEEQNEQKNDGATGPISIDPKNLEEKSNDNQDVTADTKEEPKLITPEES